MVMYIEWTCNKLRLASSATWWLSLFASQTKSENPKNSANNKTPTFVCDFPARLFKPTKGSSKLLIIYLIINVIQLTTFRGTFKKIQNNTRCWRIRGFKWDRLWSLLCLGKFPVLLDRKFDVGSQAMSFESHCELHLIWFSLNLRGYIGSPTQAQ